MKRTDGNFGFLVSLERILIGDISLKASACDVVRVNRKFRRENDERGDITLRYFWFEMRQGRNKWPQLSASERCQDAIIPSKMRENIYIAHSVKSTTTTTRTKNGGSSHEKGGTRCVSDFIEISISQFSFINFFSPFHLSTRFFSLSPALQTTDNFL